MARKIIFILIVLVLISVGYLSTQTNPIITPVIHKTVVYKPIRIQIPAIDVDTQIESVMTNSKGEMDTPKNPLNTSWYSLGYKPGEAGSAVIAGHIDDPQGNPSVFARLDELEVGDKILITDQRDNILVFTVVNKAVFLVDMMPLEEIFNSKGRGLNLISCAGDWTEGGYSKRIVIYSK